MKTPLFTATALLVAACPLQAQEPERPPPTIAVHYGDLDLNLAEGRATLDRRLRAAARRVCRRYIVPSPYHPSARRRCQRATLVPARETASAAAAAQARLLLARSREP